MKHYETTIKGLFSGEKSFVIPEYQRAYSWEEQNWETFLNDIIEQLDSSTGYYYGNILLETIKEDLEYEVIDGQQRLTTLVIFIRSLINVMETKTKGNENVSYMKEDFIKFRGTIKLRPVDYDRTYFNEVIVENKEDTAMTDSQMRYKRAKDFFTKRLNDKSLSDLQRIKEMISNTKINRLELSGKKESALMFELHNNRGKALTNLEKLKSYFMYEMYVHSSKEEIENNIEIISSYFKGIYRNVYHIKGLDEDSILIYHCNAYLNIAFGYRNLNHIKEEYKKNEKASGKIEWIKSFCRNLAYSFESLRKFESCNLEYLERLKNIRHNKDDSTSEKTLPTFVYPFIIKGYKYFDDDNRKLNDLLHLMEILSFRYYLIGGRAELNSRLSEIIREFKCEEDENKDRILSRLRDSLKEKLNKENHWSDMRTKQVLEGWMYGNRVLPYLLWQYENSLQGKGYSIGSCQITSEQIEHISPQNPPQGETLASGYDVDENNQYSDEFCEKYLNCIGNLMLIAGSHNASIGNKPFEEKLKTYESTPLKQQKELVKFLSEGDPKKWKTDQIIKRKQAILEFAIPQWSFDNVKLQK